LTGDIGGYRVRSRAGEEIRDIMGFKSWMDSKAETLSRSSSDELWDKAEKEGYRLEVSQARGVFGGQSPFRAQYEWTLYKGGRPVKNSRAISPKSATQMAGIYLSKHVFPAPEETTSEDATPTDADALPRGESMEIEEGDYRVTIKNRRIGYDWKVTRSESKRFALTGGITNTLDEAMDKASAKIAKYTAKDEKKAK
jgi:hypothetical protein